MGPVERMVRRRLHSICRMYILKILCSRVTSRDPVRKSILILLPALSLVTSERVLWFGTAAKGTSAFLLVFQLSVVFKHTCENCEQPTLDAILF